MYFHDVKHGGDECNNENKQWMTKRKLIGKNCFFFYCIEHIHLLRHSSITWGDFLPLPLFTLILCEIKNAYFYINYCVEIALDLIIINLIKINIICLIHFSNFIAQFLTGKRMTLYLPRPLLSSTWDRERFGSTPNTRRT